MVQLNFDGSNVAPMREFEAVPAGWYNVMIDQSEAKPTKDGSGIFLEIRFTILDGVYANQKLFTRLNIRNNNQQAVDIAYSELRSIAEACGIIKVADSQQLHNIPLKVKVKVRTDASGQYEPQNRISAYKHASAQVDMGAASGPPQGFGAPAAPAQPWQQPQAAPAFNPGAGPMPAQPWQQPAAAPAAPAAPAFNPAPQPPAQFAPAPIQQAPAQPPFNTAPAPGAMEMAPQAGGAMPPWANAQPAQPQAAPAQQAPQQPHPAQGAMPPWLQK